MSVRSNEFVSLYTSKTTKQEFLASAMDYVENFPDKALMELMVFDSTGEIVITSTGFEPDKEQSLPDYEQVISLSKTYAALLEKGRTIINSHTSLGIPINLNTGAISLHK